jgi:hypothetical protein
LRIKSFLGLSRSLCEHVSEKSIYRMIKISIKKLIACMTFYSSSFVFFTSRAQDEVHVNHFKLITVLINHSSWSDRSDIR